MAAGGKRFEPSGDLAEFSLVPGRSVSHQVHEWLRNEIIVGHIKPGTTLSEANLCHHFGISRQPVREALVRLTTQSLVRVYPQRGSVVTKISVPMVIRAQLIRESVEIETLARALERSDCDFLGSLATELKLQRTFAEAGDIERFFDSDQAFHRCICEQSGISGIWEGLEDTRSQLDRARHAELETQQTLGFLIDQHQAIFDAIARDDRQGAKTAMREHLRRIMEQLPKTVETAPELFEDTDLSSWQLRDSGSQRGQPAHQ